MSSIIITGSNRGLGLEFARQYAEAGWCVYACCRDPNKAPELHALREQHDNLSVHGLDVRDHRQIDVLAKNLVTENLDIVLNNAGVFYKDSEHFGGLSYEIWLDSFRINTLATAKMAEAFVTQVARSEKKLFVAITSLMGSMEDNGSGGYYPYRSSKAALNAVMKSLAVDLKPRKIGALLLHPGWVKTAMGGEHAKITPQESVRGMRKVINDFKLRNSGRFFNYKGKRLPW